MHLREIKNAYNTLVGKSEKKNHDEDLELYIHG
jgi:hypothetical protein